MRDHVTFDMTCPDGRAKRLTMIAGIKFTGQESAGEAFLSQSMLELGDKTPLEAARSSKEGLDSALSLLKTQRSVRYV